MEMSPSDPSPVKRGGLGWQLFVLKSQSVSEQRHMLSAITTAEAPNKPSLRRRG
jgi:hypothetical protein